MAGDVRHTLKLRYEGGAADDQQLDLYDGTTSIHGFAQALQIATHAFLNDKIISRATALKGAKMYLQPLRRGSFIVEIVTLIEQYPGTASVISAVAAAPFYDFIKVAMSKAVGLIKVAPETPQIRKRFERDEPFFDQLAETLEGSLQRGHRVIDEGVGHVSLERPRSKLVTFNSDTKDWVGTRDESSKTIRLHGNVTRFNSLSRNGRAYIRELSHFAQTAISRLQTWVC